MVVMSDFTNEQLKGIVAFGIDTIKDELVERIENENKTKFPVFVGDCFFNEEEQSVYKITNKSNNRIFYEMVRVHQKQICFYNSFEDIEYHNFDSMVKVDKEIFDAFHRIAENYETGLQELKLSSIKSANNIMSSVKK